MDQIKIGKYIAEKRKSLGLTQMQLADKLNMSNKSVSKWERGVCLPDVSLYEPLCETLGISINEFIAGEDIVPEDAAIHADRNIISITADGTVKRNRLRRAIALLIGIILILLSAFIWFLKSQDYFLSNYIKPYSKDSDEYRAATMLLDPIEANMFHYQVDAGFTQMVLTVYGYEKGKLVTGPDESIGIDLSYFGKSEKRSGTIAALYKLGDSKFTLLNTDKYGSQSGEFMAGDIVNDMEPSGVVYVPVEDTIDNISENEEYPICGYYFDGDEVTGVSPSEYFLNHEDNPAQSAYAIIITVKFLKEDVTEVSVPDLEGMSLDDAISYIKESSLTLGNIEYIEASDNEEYLVKSQDPAAGSFVPEGSSVDVSVIKEK